MRLDSRNLLARLDQPDFDYRDFPASEGGDDTPYRWPLIEFVHRATVAAYPAAAMRQPAWDGYGQQAAAPAPGYAPPSAPHVIDLSGSGGFFAHYRPYVAPQATPPAPPPPPAPPQQDLGSLFASYSDGR